MEKFKRNTSIDPITFEVLRNAFKSVVNEMNLVLSRSAYSAIITEGEDHCGAIFDAWGNLIMQGDTSLPIFIGIIEFPCKTIIKKYGEKGINPGDVIMTNSGFAGGSHINDVIFIKPVFYEEQLLGFTSVIGHWTDVGGSEPGSIVPNATEYYEEGILYPPIKILDRGKLNREVLDIILANTRISEDTRGDFEAQIASLGTGNKRMQKLVQKYGLNCIKLFMEKIIIYSESMIKARIEKTPDGTYIFEDYSDFESLDNPQPLVVRLALTIKGEKLIFDFNGSAPQANSSFNNTYSITASGVFVVLHSLFPDIPINHGCFKAIKIIAPENTVVNAQPPAAISGAFATILEKVVGVVLGAFSQVFPKRVIACPYNMVNISLGGYDKRYNKSYVMYIYSEGGLGARATKDGVSGVVSLFGGSTKFPPVEVLEKRFPIRFTQWSFEIDSGGPGKYRGGLGSIKKFIITAEKSQLMVLGDREKYPPFGLFGGKEGAAQRLEMKLADGRHKKLSLKTSRLPLHCNDEVIFYSSGGGGYGQPLDRLPENVLDDVIKGYVSVKAALQNYGVVIEGPPYRINKDSTRIEKEKRSQGGG